MVKCVPVSAIDGEPARPDRRRRPSLAPATASPQRRATLSRSDASPRCLWRRRQQLWATIASVVVLEQLVGGRGGHGTCLWPWTLDEGRN